VPRISKLVDIALDDRLVIRRNPDIEHEQAVAIFDLLEENVFDPAVDDPGPFRLKLGTEENRLIFDIRSDGDEALTKVALSLVPLRRVIKDYFAICESYFEAIKTARPAQIEAIDMGRRGLHNEGSELLQQQLAGKIETDFSTARRLFTLICVLHIRG
jgi:uncharacterized protein (UPF0262 family)